MNYVWNQYDEITIPIYEGYSNKLGHLIYWFLNFEFIDRLQREWVKDCYGKVIQIDCKSK